MTALDYSDSSGRGYAAEKDVPTEWVVLVETDRGPNSTAGVVPRWWGTRGRERPKDEVVQERVVVDCEGRKRAWYECTRMARGASIAWSLEVGKRLTEREQNNGRCNVKIPSLPLHPLPSEIPR